MKSSKSNKLNIFYISVHLADAFIQRHLHCIQGTLYQFLFCLEIEPRTLALFLLYCLSFRKDEQFFKKILKIYIYKK